MPDFEDKSLTGFEKSLIEANSYELIQGNIGFREAALATERELIDGWANTTSDQTEIREQVWLKVQLLRDLLAELDRHYTEYVAGNIENIENIH